ncbi:class I SAM-dependent methyltransferase [Streptomonospora nanhaiensis]|uniref:SAM-dependent methyltransferase n=1 Tax=Streptomonospora nanhaiensis TaxID=1323731 RepID=A0A853BKD4_9ACTN|nr:class I SAM-dependent methyltransferase [Streptomonospora nanhaiensis]MBV2362324.1 class I SAM-dependent methyltransferase [Streptomonospora nanhaiensis]MBX9388200.1 class I SAM-dependent methyltransferase [Streptomonospora nanhaiensis]NYI95021.1 SAM-dependent methyltransferase [Streptomonospora nanhaiensis]
MADRELWTGRPPGSNPFALPRGPLGRAAGWVLAFTNRAQNAEVLRACRVAGCRRVLEVGHGPGVLVRMLAEVPGVNVTGVDPSPEMVAMARRRNAAGVRAGRVRLHRGTAADTGEPDAAFDLVLSVNTVAMWPYLDPGMAEFHRVLRPGGRAVVTWHRFPESFRLSAAQFALVEEAMAKRFGAAERRLLPGSVVFEAVKEPEPGGGARAAQGA